MKITGDTIQSSLIGYLAFDTIAAKMKSLLGKFVFLLLLVLPTAIMIFESGPSGRLVVNGDDPMEGEVDAEDDDDEGIVETDDGLGDDGEQAVSETDKVDAEEEEEAETQIKPSPDADAIILFTKPTVSSDLPSGQVVRFLVGFKNNGDEDFLVETMDASFRYPQDFSFIIQNFTSGVYNQVIESKREATFEYGFTPSEQFNARPFGLTILLNYKDKEGNVFQHAVFNETINVVEPDEGLDGETFFLYVFLAALVVLCLVGAQQLLSRFGRKHTGILGKAKQQPIEMGTQKNDVDYSWLPQGTVPDLNKSPKQSPKGRSSPRKRGNKRGSGEE